MKLIVFIAIVATCFQIGVARTTHHGNPFGGLLRRGRTTSWNSTTHSKALSSTPIVDLGYVIYHGVHNASWSLNTFKGIRFAAPPTGPLRWQLPQSPIVDRSHVVQADQLGSQCPQAFKASGFSPAEQAEFVSSLGPSSEDCLFLNVYAPVNASNLPVMVYIHGGGYGYGNANQDLSSIIAANDNGFIGVGIQYRLGVFGFLASDEVNRFGVVNAGLRDQEFALKWIQSYIHLFGGNASQVTIAGESAGAGSVMLHSMAYGGELGETLFTNVIAASPYLPTQYMYDSWVPSQAYYAFAAQAGCWSGAAFGNTVQNYSTIFDCLVNRASSILMEANSVVTASGTYGTWAFTPVTDGIFMKQTPSRQLFQHRVNGARILSGNNGNEGPDFVPQNITTEADVISWLGDIYPMLTSGDVSKVLLYYPSRSTAVSDAMAVLNTIGTRPNNEAIQQQRANEIYAESTFVCPSYWLAEAFSTDNRQAFRYQYSVLPALHGSDFNGYFGPPVSNIGLEFMNYFQRIWGNFIMYNNPSVDNGDGVIDENLKAVSAWPVFSDDNPMQTGGEIVTDLKAFPLVSYGNFLNSTYYVNPGLQPNFTLVNAYTWEGGRGYRCDFWRSIGSAIPE